MTIKERLESDLKTAMLGGDKVKVTTLRGLKSAILYAEVDKGVRDQGLSEEDVMAVLGREAKKRQESADLYIQAGDRERQAAELTEKSVIEQYLPAQLSEADISQLIDKEISKLGDVNPQQMGQIIGQVKNQAGPTADGAMIARLVKEKLAS